MFSTNQYVRPAYNVRMNRVLCCIVLPYLEKKTGSCWYTYVTYPDTLHPIVIKISMSRKIMYK